MSGAQEYYDSLIAQGYTPEQATGFTQQHFPGFSPVAPQVAPMEQFQVDQSQVQAVAQQHGVDPNQLAQTARHFDANQDGVLQQSELQATAQQMVSTAVPAAPQPMAAPMAAAPMGQPMAAPMGAPMGGMMSASSGDAPGVLNWVALGLTAVAITMVFIAMFSNSWMTGEEDEVTVAFGLSEIEIEYDGDSDTEEFSDCEDDNDDCQDVASAGTTGQIFLWIAVSAAIGSLVLMCLNNFNVYSSKFGMIACFVSGGLAIAGAIIWLIMFPELEDFDVFDLGPGMAFYMAIIAGVCSVGSGVCELKS